MSNPVQTEVIVPPKLTPEFLQAVAAAAAKAGLTIPPAGEGAPDAPTLRLEWGWRRLGHELGGILRGQNIFQRGGELGLVDVRTGGWVKFDQRNFAGWVEEFCAFTWRGDKTSLIGEHAAMLMAQFTFRHQIRELEAIHMLRLPVMRADGQTEWLAQGYDGPSKIFTCDLLQYPMDMALGDALDFLREKCEDYPWMKAENEGENLMGNRSYAVHVAAMVGAYCRAMFPAGVLRPMVLYTSNQQGSGKSTLAQMDFVPVFGLTAANDMPKSDDELAKELASAAQAFTPFLFLDDIGSMLRSTKLNRFITSPRHAGRILGFKDRFDVAAVTQIFATGNNVKGSRDLAERALIVELFYPGDLSRRKFKEKITPTWLARVDVRRQFLGSLCALVRHWAAADDATKAVLAKIEGHPRFSEWTKLIAEIVIFSGHTNPLVAPLMPLDEEEDDVKELLIAAADAELGDRVFNRAQLVDLAREKELLEDVVGLAGEKELDSKANKRFGLRLRAWRGRELFDSKGRRFRFGHRRQKQGATYPLTFLS